MRYFVLAAIAAMQYSCSAVWSQSTEQTVVKQAVVQRPSVSFEAALSIAQAAYKAGKGMGFDFAVCVVDGAGLPLVVLRTDNGTEHCVDTATSKAWTAVNFRNSTRNLFEKIKKGEEADSQLPFSAKASFLRGGVPLKDGDTVVGGIGIAGSPHGYDDEAAAAAGIAEFTKLLQK